MKKAVGDASICLSSQPLCSLEEVQCNLHHSVGGFYWIYTKQDISRLKKAPASSNSAHVNIGELAAVHEGLPNVIPQIDSEYWCVYNGKGKSLKARIVAEFSNTEGPTGTLALTRCFSEDVFKIRYLICDTKQFEHSYKATEMHFERVWRLTFGWPVLCRA